MKVADVECCEGVCFCISALKRDSSLFAVFGLSLNVGSLKHSSCEEERS